MPYESVRDRMLRKWAHRQQEARGVQRWLTVGLVVAATALLAFGWALAGRLSAGARAQYCRGNVRHLAKGLLDYAADYDECLPPPGADASAVLLPYVFGDPRRCPELSSEDGFSYGIVQTVGGASLGGLSTAPELTVVIIETRFRHRFRGEQWGAAVLAHMELEYAVDSQGSHTRRTA